MKRTVLEECSEEAVILRQRIAVQEHDGHFPSLLGFGLDALRLEE